MRFAKILAVLLLLCMLGGISYEITNDQDPAVAIVGKVYIGVMLGAAANIPLAITAFLLHFIFRKSGNA
jgi:hypothetical protein